MEKLIEAIKESEGFVPTVYKCTAGYDTIGYGFAIKDLYIDEDIAEMILHRKLSLLAERVCDKFPFVKDLPQEAQDVVYEMCYQLGITGFSKFKKTIQFLRLGSYKSAAVEMLDSRWAREQTPNRAKRLSDIIKEL
jgi:lysozyme|tara:strand:+ start:18 stop:425 length:408 start_codon:yes stop_codon:yes gene_type:complete